MKKFNILKHLRRLLPLILGFCVLVTYAVHYKMVKSNQYVASEVIHYNDENAEKGKAPTGDKLDVNEIKSSAVMSKVVERMGLTGTYSVDGLISRITITPLPDADKVAQKEAKLEDGEEYVYEPSSYTVSFAATSSEGADFARTVLDETLDVYFAEYSQKYVNVAAINNTIENLNDADYDYIETMEMIDSAIDDTLETLSQRMGQNQYYRSTNTGESFSDLADDFNYIRNSEISEIFSKIYKYQITKNKSMLISDYTTRIDNNNISNEKEKSIVNDVLTVINEYVAKMRNSGNTNISSDYILDNLHEKNLVDGSGNAIAPGDQTVTYDELIYGWRDHNESKEHAIIDTAYCTYVINTFQNCTGLCGGACAYSDKTCSELSNADYQQVKQEVDDGIKSLIKKLNKLYNITLETNDEYNEYLGASYISVLSSASVKESINVKLYTLIAFFFLIIVCFGGAVVLARIGDIIGYIFYTDHLTGLSNRAYFDRYLKSMDKKLLDDGVVYCLADIVNLAKINAQYSRQTGDEVIKVFKKYLVEVFGKTNAEFVYNGNGSFIVLVNNSDYITVEDIMKLFSLRLDDREEYREIKIEYKIGIAESFRERHSARKLLSEAIRSKKEYVSEADGQSEEK